LGSLNRCFLVLALCTLGACTQALKTPLAKQKTDSAIIGGEVVTGRDLTSQSVVGVLVQNKNTGDYEICSGTLLKNNLVLTAAHCVSDSDGSLIVSVIFDNVISPNGNAITVIREVNRTAIPAWWGAETHLDTDTGDIALLQYTGDTPRNYSPITALASEDDITNNTQILIAGFGVNKVTTKPINVNTYPDLIGAIQAGQVSCKDSVRLQSCVEIKMEGAGVLRQATSKIRNSRYSSSEIEVSPQSGSTCHGDSGGPAFIVKNNKLYLWGVANRSANNSLTDCSTNSIYASVPFYRQWLNMAATNIREESTNR
jgi:secreted trypsin-like serine protease